MREEIEGAANSLELSQIQRQLLATEFFDPIDEPAAPSAIEANLEVVAARYQDIARDLNCEFADADKQIRQSPMGSMGRALRRLEVLEEIAAKKAKARLRIYGEVAKEFDSPSMLSDESLRQFEKLLKFGLQQECAAVRQRTERDCRAAGDAPDGAVAAHGRRYATVEARVTDVILNGIRSLKAESQARRPRLEHSNPAPPESHAKALERRLELISDGAKTRAHAQALREVQIEDKKQEIRLRPIAKADVPTGARSEGRGTIGSEMAVRRMDDYIRDAGMSDPEFARRAGTTDRTLRSFRATLRVRRSIFDGIASAMGITRDELLGPGGK